MSGEEKFDPKKFSDDLHDHIHKSIEDRIHAPRAMRAMGPGVWPGLILVAVGTAVLLDHMGIITVDRLWRFWPVLLIAVGAVRFVDSCNRTFSVLLMAVGALFLLGNLGYIRLTMADFWPIVLIAIGIALIWSRFEIPRLSPTSSGGPNSVNATTMFGGVERRITTSNFTGGTVTATFGGVELDFRAADMEGEEATLYVEAIFGGIEIVIPERWTAIYEGQSIFGGYNDETRPPLPDVPGAAPKKRLVLRGQAVFGGITVKN